MSDVAVLTAGGIVRAADVVDIAAAAGLELAAAAVLLTKESGGGHNVWGHDDVVVAPHTYVKGGPVDQGSYGAYAAAVQAGRAGRQGCGPTQLTSGSFQQRADAAGGCWRFEVNCRVGFEILAAHIRTRGVRNGFRAYNGSGPAAEAYADDAQTRYQAWKATLIGDDDMPTAEEIAAAVWSQAIRNGFGDTVGAQQILVGAEKRIADLQQAVATLTTQVAQLRAHQVDPVAIPHPLQA